MVNSIAGSGTHSLEDLKAQMETLKQQRDVAKGAKEGAETGKTSAESAKSTASSDKTNADSIKSQAEVQKGVADNAVIIAEQTARAAAMNLESANSYVEGAAKLLADAQNADPVNESAINSAQAAYDRAVEKRDAAKKAVEEAEEGLQKSKEAQTKANDALEKAASDAEDAAAVLEEASAALDTAVKELDEAVETLEEAEEKVTNAETRVKEAESADAAGKGEAIMNEEQALQEGYTVIKSFDDLQKIGNNLGGKYILMGDIDIPDGVNWSPIGNEDSPFTGVFNGNGFNIKNLNISVNENDAKNVGFFGVTDGATIQDVTFVDAKVNGKTDYLNGTYNAGILAGCIKRTNISGVNVTGDSSVSGYASVGGLIGAVDDRGIGGVDNGNSYIENCHTDVTVSSKYAAGGLIGYVTSTDDRTEDHRGIVNKSLVIRDCSTTGSAIVDDESVGGIIGESGKTLITLDKCSSDMDLTWTNEDGLGDLSFLLETGRIGGLVGNINGSYITLANCEFEGSLNGDTEFQSEVYGWYMDDAHVCIYDIPAGLPADDILNISGVDGMTLVTQSDGTQKYECTVSTLAGLDKMVGMIKANPSLADQVIFNVNFDFNAMDGEYTYSEYAQYGIVQHLYEDEDGKVHNDVYIDNECDLESTYHASESALSPVECNEKCKCDLEYTMVSGLYKSKSMDKTMVPGLQKDNEYKYYVDTEEGLKEVTVRINAEGQITDIKTRLTESEVRYRDRLAEVGKAVQQQMRDVLKDMYNWDKDESVPILTKAEYKQLLKKAQKYGIDSLSDKEKLGMAVFEADYDIMNAQAKYTKNLGCGMGGNASFLDKTTTYQMTDENGNALFTTLDGDQLIKDENGNYAYADGSGSYFGMAEVFEQRGYQKTDTDGNLLFTYTSEDGVASTVTQVKGEDGSVSYITTDADGNEIPFEGDVDSLERQLTPANYSEDFEGFSNDVEKILQDVKDGKYPKPIEQESEEEISANSESDSDAVAAADTGTVEDVDDKDLDIEPEI